MNQISPEYIQEWVDRAERDLSIARLLRQTEFYDDCALHCQQAVEKLLKAYYLAKRAKDAPRTHKVVELGEMLGLPQDLLDDLHDLETDYIEARYPDAAFGGGHTVYDAAVADERLGIATQVMDWVKPRIAEVPK